jgi:hypothetical protein
VCGTGGPDIKENANGGEHRYHHGVSKRIQQHPNAPGTAKLPSVVLSRFMAEATMQRE